MKKILLATTALVATASFAAADVSISGSAEMGLVGGDDQETRFHQDIDVTFKMSGETDGGLSFGAAVDLDEAQDNVGVDVDALTNIPTINDSTNDALDDTDQDGGVAIFISGDFGTLTLGDTDGALDWAATEAGNVGNPGSIADNETAHAGYQGSYADGAYDGQILRYDNTFGDFGVAVSVEMDDDQDGAGGNDATIDDMGFAVGLKYNVELAGLDLALGGGYQSIDGGDATALSVTTSFDNGLKAGVVYLQRNADAAGGDLTHIGIGFGYAADAFSVHLNYGQFDRETGGAADSSGFGLAAKYDLGGGAAVHFGYGMSDVDGADSTSDYSLGLSMSF
ncbi:MAG: porin [Pseudomonadota bacterium]